MKIERTNHQDVAGPDQIATGTAGTGQGNEELEWLKRHEGTAPEREKRMTGLHNDTPGDHPVVRNTPKQVQRTTGLRGREIDQVKKPKRPVRSRTERDLLAYDSDVPYAAAEKASRNLVGSLIERQDRVTESLLLLINDLQYRIDDIECRVDDLKSGKRSPVTTGTGAGREVPEWLWAQVPDTAKGTEAGSGSADRESYCDLISMRYERQDRLHARLNQKIDRLDQRLMALKGQGWS